MNRGIRRLCLAALSWALAAVPAAAQAAGPPNVPLPNFGTLLPQGAPNTAPRWLRPGLWVTYAGQVNNAPVLWQFWVTQVSQGYAAVAWFKLEVAFGTPEILSPTSVVTPFAQGPFWLGPGALAHLPNGIEQVPVPPQGNPATTIVDRLRITWNGAPRAVVRVQQSGPTGAQTIVYDQSTGLALQATFLVRGGYEGTLRLAGIQELPYPFTVSAPLPTWVRAGTVLQYRVADQTELNGFAGPPNYGSSDVRIAAVRGPFAQFAATTSITYTVGSVPVPQQSTQVGAGGGSYGIYWLAPAVARQIRRALVLFAYTPWREAFTASPAGSDVALVLSFGPSRLAGVFDPRSGILVQWVQSGPLTATGATSQTIVGRLAGVGP